MRSKTLVLGLGNTLLADEGVGVHALAHLRNTLAKDAPDLLDRIELLDGGTLSFTLAGAIEDHSHLIVIDASRFNASPGTVRVFEGAAMDNFLGNGKRSSVHEVSLLDLLAVATLAGHLPRRRALIGVEPESIDWADSPTPSVGAAIPEVCRQVIALARRWHHGQADVPEPVAAGANP
ncbi:MAG: HyaD/HybD family hydrogenase maturation endopeptidase [Acidiferrobacteraceae bacterium]